MPARKPQPAENLSRPKIVSPQRLSVLAGGDSSGMIEEVLMIAADY